MIDVIVVAAMLVGGYLLLLAAAVVVGAEPRNSINLAAHRKAHVHSHRHRHRDSKHRRMHPLRIWNP